MALVLSGTALADATPDAAFESAFPSPSIRGVGDDPIPWPWGMEMPFPWSFVQGVWLVEQSGFKAYFAFRIVKSKEGLRQLEVRQVDPQNCLLLAQGVGFEANRIVRAQMTARNGVSYRVTLRSFNEKSIPVRLDTKPVNGQYVVLSLWPFEKPSAMHMPMSLITNRLDSKCQILP